MKIVVTGATGLIGKALVTALRSRGDQIAVLTRSPERARERLGDVDAIAADIETAGPWQLSLAKADAVIHLAGEPIAGGRWNARHKQVIRDSRVEGTRTLVEGIAALSAGERPRALVTASGVDYYPFASRMHDFDDDEVTESDPPGDTFLARVCRDWEREAAAATAVGVRVASMRTGVVLGPGGALAKMATPFKMFVGGRIGSGEQWMSWIHLDDVVAAYLAASSDDRYVGPINLVAPDAVRNADLARALGKVLHRPSWLPVPGFAVKLAVGELAEYLLEGRRVVPKKLRELGLAWKHGELVS
ncbi:MAG TPA: TIGR01777 family oxidoreductase, partial [Kofleriaceae bacterium]|nr:TIGR01777 family oxidoreductase [Kofleriaceae bacterium]